MIKAAKTSFMALIVALLLAASPAMAQTEGLGPGNIKIGPLEIHPSVGLTETYSDNIYRSYDNEPKESDLITTLSPGIQFLLPMGSHSFQIGYRADINWFADNSETNYTKQVAGGAFNFAFPGGLTFTVSDYYTDSVVPRKWKEQPGLSGASDPYREKPYKANDLKVKAKYKFVDRWATEVRYGNYNYEYDESYDDSGSYDRNLFGGSIYYSLTAKTDILVDYNYSKVDYKISKESDNQNHMAYIGLSFDPTAKVRGYLKLGMAEKKYEETVAGRDDDFTTFSSLVNLGYNMSPYDILSLKVSRVIKEDEDTNAPFYETDVSLGYRHIFAMNEKISMNVNVGYRKDKFKESSIDVDSLSKIRDDDKWYGGAGIEYALQDWINLSLQYTYTDNQSNFLRYDYKENRVFLRIAVVY